MHTLKDLDHYTRSQKNTFAVSALDRLSLHRLDEAWLAEQVQNPQTRIVPVWQGENLVSQASAPEAVFLSPADLGALWQDASPPILLGALDGQVYFAIEAPSLEGRPHPIFEDFGVFKNLRAFGPFVPGDIAALLACAKAMTYWHQRHQFCGDCGSPTISTEAGFVRDCTNADCAKKHFPRSDPAIIVLVQYGQKALLGRQASWPEGMYSTIAGFVEPGESLEAAVVREVHEETGVKLAEITYHSSQPWPFPSSLMLGYMAQAADPAIQRNDEELEDAQWFSREDLVKAIKTGTMFVPASLSISHRLIETWFDAGDQGTLQALLSA